MTGFLSLCICEFFAIISSVHENTSIGDAIILHKAELLQEEVFKIGKKISNPIDMLRGATAICGPFVQKRIWWVRLDSNQRRIIRRIYSAMPLPLGD